MSRNKDISWTLPESNNMSYEAAQLAVLMDLRDELKRLNGLLHCSNFLAIPARLEAIRINTRKKRRVKGARR
jgi:hypothetical protein